MMTEKPMISVVMANYNGGKYIKEAINSVLQQDYTDYEFIIVDDGSNDNSKEIIVEFCYQYPNLIMPIYLPRNQGQGAAFNQGIDAASGRIISFLDSDDIWFSEKLGIVHDVFRSQDEIALYQHNLFILRDSHITKEKFNHTLEIGNMFEDSRLNGKFPLFMPTSGLSIPKVVLNNVLPIPNSFQTCADGYLTRTSYCYGKVHSSFECLGAYRVHRNNQVFENPKFDMDAYITGLLLPTLNKYYCENDLDLEFPIRQRWIDMLLDVSPRKLIKNILPKKWEEPLVNLYKKMK